MTTGNSITIRGLTKTYSGEPSGPKRLLRALFGRRLGGKRVKVLDGIDLDVPQGQTLGIVGRNGCGKSTLLQLICSVLEPDEGTVTVNGEIAALLELGAGFRRDFTGRENARMVTELKGLSGEAKRRVIEEAKQFSELGDFFDRRVQTYSSGMFVRLAFATSVSLDPEILIVDEALAVGDISFQNKCYRKFVELKDRKKTILFVSHDAEQVVRHSDRAILIEGGRIIRDGPPRDVANHYLEKMQGPSHPGESVVSGSSLGRDPLFRRKHFNPSFHRFGTGVARVVDAWVRTASGEDPVSVRVGERIELCLAIECRDAVEHLSAGFAIKSLDGMTLYGTNHRFLGRDFPSVAAGERILCVFSFPALFGAGHYFIDLGVEEASIPLDPLALDRLQEVLYFSVSNPRVIGGLVDLQASVRIESRSRLDSFSQAVERDGPSAQF